MNSIAFVNEQMKALWPYLRAFKIQKVILNYDGGGDNGQFEQPQFEAENELPTYFNDSQVDYYALHSTWDSVRGVWERKTEWIKSPLRDVLEEVASRAVSINHLGWENNEGGEGRVTIDCENFVVLVEHTEFIRSEEHYEHSFDISPSALEELTMRVTEGGE